MCRLYGMRASHPTRVECELIEAQNALIEQSIEDERGLENPHGWGVGLVGADGSVRCARQVGPAHESEAYRTEAMDAHALAVIAHVRRATVGEPSVENTHPFRDGDSLFAHNGHVGSFDDVRDRLLDELADDRRDAITGSTDSEHFFQLVLEQYHAQDASGSGVASPMIHALREATASLERIMSEAVAFPLFLNTLWLEDGALAGTKKGRSLWVLERNAPIDCSICSRPHATPPSGESYRVVVVASERITDEDWQEVPEDTVFQVGDDTALQGSLALHMEPLEFSTPT